MKKAELTIGKWHFKIGILPIYFRPGKIVVHFGVFKLLKVPNEGWPYTKDDYKGFWFRKEWSGFDIGFYF